MATQLTDKDGNPIDVGGTITIVRQLLSGIPIATVNDTQLYAPSSEGSGGGGSSSARSVKIVCYGNSFTQDSMSYVPTILKKICPQLTFVIAIAYIGGCPLAQHYANFSNQSQTVPNPSGGTTTYDPTTYILYKYTSTDSYGWRNQGRKTAQQILADEAWDIVTFQEGGAYAHRDWDVYYKPFIFNIHKAIYDNVSNKSVKLGWLSIHGTYRDSASGDYENYNGVIANTQKVMALTGIELLFPYGTAIQNLRTTPLNALGVYGNLKYDVAHLQEGIGCLTAAYTNALVILNAIGYGDISIVGDDTTPTNDWASEHLVVGAHGTVIGINANNIYTAQMAAIQAIKKPYEVTDCTDFYYATT